MIELKAFVDESGTHGSGLTAMAGWVGYAERWAKFEPRWRSLLLRNGLRYLHAIDLKQGKRAFRDKVKWPFQRRLALAQEAGQLTEDHAICSLSLFMRSVDYEAAYIGGDRNLRKRRAPVDSKYGVCARIFLSMLAELVERISEDAQVTVVFEAGAANQGAAQDILTEMYEIAPWRARLINPKIDYAPKEQSPGIQAADCLVYPVYVQERDGIADVSAMEPGWPDKLPFKEVTHLRVPITAEALQGLKQGQMALRGLRRRLGRHWGHLEGFRVGWTTASLQSVDGFLLCPPPRQSPLSLLQEGAPDPGIPEPDHYVHLESV